jgi:hypothetical protein
LWILAIRKRQALSLAVITTAFAQGSICLI